MADAPSSPWPWQSDAAGNWAWADGSHVDADFLVSHSFDGLKVRHKRREAPYRAQ
jgi:hypothetical protein